MKSLLDLDLYQLTMQQLVFHRFSNVDCEYKFVCRNVKGGGEGSGYLFKYVSRDEIKEALSKLDPLLLDRRELDYLSRLGYFKNSYLRYLKDFRFDVENDLTIPKNGEGWDINAKGPWARIIPYETMVLSTVNQVFAKNWMEANSVSTEEVYRVAWERLQDKIDVLKSYVRSCEGGKFGFRLIEFGTRRRLHSAWQTQVIKYLQEELGENLVGTSNVFSAMQFDLKAIGTFSHVLPMGMQGLVPVQHSAREAYKIWSREYRGLWGICLPDTLGHKKFFKDFSLELAKLYDGVRHDSGNPVKFANDIIAMYEGYGIDPREKCIVFSDGLDIPKAIKLHEIFGRKIQCSFGIGTDLTNDTIVPTPQVVMKMSKSHGQPVAKISESKGKNQCADSLYMEYLKHSIKNYE